MSEPSCIESIQAGYATDSGDDLTSQVSSTADTRMNEAFEQLVHGQRGEMGLIGRNHQMLKDLVAYHRANWLCGDAGDELRALFQRFLARGFVGGGLHLLSDRDSEVELGPNWTTTPLDSIEQVAQEAGTASLRFAAESFDVVLCNGLNRISRPASLVSEIRRVLRAGGQVWAQIPLNSPYRSDRDGTAAEYWRITPDGLRVLFERFDEIMCSAYLPQGSVLHNCSFFYGLKPTAGADKSVDENTAKISLFPL